jgi:hypothetical protein
MDVKRLDGSDTELTSMETFLYDAFNGLKAVIDFYKTSWHTSDAELVFAKATLYQSFLRDEDLSETDKVELIASTMMTDGFTVSRLKNACRWRRGMSKAEHAKNLKKLGLHLLDIHGSILMTLKDE